VQSARQFYNPYGPAGKDVDLETVAVEQTHPEQRLRLGNLDTDGYAAPVPIDEGVANWKMGDAAIAQISMAAPVDEQAELIHRLLGQRYKSVESCIDDEGKPRRLLASSRNGQFDHGFAPVHRPGDHGVRCFKGWAR